MLLKSIKLLCYFTAFVWAIKTLLGNDIQRSFVWAKVAVPKTLFPTQLLDGVGFWAKNAKELIQKCLCDCQQH